MRTEAASAGTATGARYRPKRGMLVEMLPRGANAGERKVAYYMRAECQPEEVKDFKTMIRVCCTPG